MPRRKNLPVPEYLRRAYSVPEYCLAFGTSKSNLYHEWREGKGPRRYKRGNKVFISVEAAAEHQRQLEAEALAGGAA